MAERQLQRRRKRPVAEEPYVVNSRDGGTSFDAVLQSELLIYTMIYGRKSTAETKESPASEQPSVANGETADGLLKSFFGRHC